MQALTWQGKRHVDVKNVPDPAIQQPDDAIHGRGRYETMGEVVEADLVAHRVPLSDAPAAYEMFQKKTDGCIKVVLDPQK